MRTRRATRQVRYSNGRQITTTRVIRPDNRTAASFAAGSSSGSV